MAMPKYAAKKDDNHREIVAALRGVGASVIELGKPVDLLVGYRGVTYPTEVKNRTGKNKDTPTQLKFYAEWRGNWLKVWTVEDALRGIGAINEN